MGRHDRHLHRVPRVARLVALSVPASRSPQACLVVPRAHRACIILEFNPAGPKGLVYFHEPREFAQCEHDEVFENPLSIVMHLPLDQYSNIVRLLETPGLVHFGFDDQGKGRAWIAGMPVVRPSAQRVRKA